MSKQDRQGVRTASDLERKYQFDKQFAEIMGVSLDAQKSVSELKSSVKSDMNTLSTGLQGELAKMDSTLRDDMGQLDSSLRDEMGQMDSAIRDDMGEMDESVRREIIEQSTSMTRNAETMIITALQRYAETKDLEEVKKTIQTEFQVWADGILGRVTATAEAVASVDGDLQEKFNTITKYFAFNINGLTIGQADNPYKIVIDNDDITIYSGEKIVQTFRADGTALIPMLTVTKEASLVGLKIIDRGTHLDFEYMGGE